jgi:hypothetical protein
MAKQVPEINLDGVKYNAYNNASLIYIFAKFWLREELRRNEGSSSTDVFVMTNNSFQAKVEMTLIELWQDAAQKIEQKSSQNRGNTLKEFFEHKNTAWLVTHTGRRVDDLIDDENFIKQWNLYKNSQFINRKRTYKNQQNMDDGKVKFWFEIAETNLSQNFINYILQNVMTTYVLYNSLELPTQKSK